MNTCEKFRNMFALNLTYFTWNCFEPITNCIEDMANLKEKILKRVSSWRQMQREQWTNRNTMKFPQTKHYVEQLPVT